MSLKKQGPFLIHCAIFILLYLSLIIYSYTQVDLNLTLSQNSFYLSVQNSLSQLGYYKRDLSAFTFAALLGGLFLNYLGIYLALKKKLINKSQLFTLITISLILVFAYPAFSHDLFNYLFDARIVTKYGLDPQYFRALDFPNDTWTRFMRWTHRYYPYGPLWLIISLVPSFLGFGKFVLTLLFFKLLFAFFHVVNLYYIRVIAEKTKLINPNYALAFYAFNPLIIIESLVSPHNEVLMVSFVLLAIYFFISNKKIWFIVSMFFSAGIKFVSIVLLPLFFKKRENWWRQFFLVSLLMWSVALIPVILQREPYSWYLIPIVALASFLSTSRWISSFTNSLTIGLLARYWPFLKYGSYSQEVTYLQTTAFFIAFIASFAFSFVIWRKFSLQS